MSQTATAVSVPVVDADSHVIEPADLWTSRMPSKYADIIPRVDINPDTGHNHWRVGDHWLYPVGYLSMAGWNDYPPSAPWELEETDPAGYIPAQRLMRMDEYGIDMQVLYPNIIGFHAPLFMDLGDSLS